MHLTPRELDKLMIYMMAEVALKRKAKGLKLNHPEAVAVITASALDGAREGKSLEQVMKEARSHIDAERRHGRRGGNDPAGPAGSGLHGWQPPGYRSRADPVTGRALLNGL